ncbi:MAG: hypothetical protein RID81_07110 [Sandaracinaceae bacterium]
MTTTTNEPAATIECPNCNGKGEIPYFAHVDGGICYQCDGEGVLDYTPETAGASTLRELTGFEMTVCVEAGGIRFQLHTSNHGDRAHDVRVFAIGEDPLDFGVDREGPDALHEQGVIWFRDGRAESSDGMKWLGQKMDLEGKRTLFAAARCLYRAARACPAPRWADELRAAA